MLYSANQHIPYQQYPDRLWSIAELYKSGQTLVQTNEFNEIWFRIGTRGDKDKGENLRAEKAHVMIATPTVLGKEIKVFLESSFDVGLILSKEIKSMMSDPAVGPICLPERFSIMLCLQVHCIIYNCWFTSYDVLEKCNYVKKIPI